MSDHDEVERVPAEADFDLSRRALLRLGLLSAAAAAHGVGVLPPGVAAEDAKPGLNLIGKLEGPELITDPAQFPKTFKRSEEHTSELQSRSDLVCRLLLEKKKK